VDESSSLQTNLPDIPVFSKFLQNLLKPTTDLADYTKLDSHYWLRLTKEHKSDPI